MLFHLRIPATLAAETRADLWCIAGEYASFTVFEVESNDELHDLLSALPLMPYLDISVTALARHPSKEDCEKTSLPSNQV
jgi:muconolactone delta-isomerase